MRSLLIGFTACLAIIAPLFAQMTKPDTVMVLDVPPAVATCLKTLRGCEVTQQTCQYFPGGCLPYRFLRERKCPNEPVPALGIPENALWIQKVVFQGERYLSDYLPGWLYYLKDWPAALGNDAHDFPGITAIDVPQGWGCVQHLSFFEHNHKNPFHEG